MSTAVACGFKWTARAAQSRARHALRSGVKASVSDETMEWAVKLAKEEFGIELEGEKGRVVNMPHKWNMV